MTAITGPGQYKEKIPSGYSKSSLQQFTPEQMELFQQMIQLLGPDSFLARLAGGGDEELFNEIEAPAKREFASTLGGIGSRYSGMGMGAQKSSAFQHENTSAAQNFAQELASQRQGLSRQAMQDLMSYSQSMMNQKPFENMLVEKAKPWWQEAGIGLASGVGKGIGSGISKFIGGL